MADGQGRALGLVFRDQVVIDTLQTAPPVTDSYRSFGYGLYRGECACLCGTIANVRNCSVEDSAAMNGITPDSGSMAERFFMGLKVGDTPKNNGAAKMILEWIDEFQVLVGQKRPKKVRA